MPVVTLDPTSLDAPKTVTLNPDELDGSPQIQAEEQPSPLAQRLGVSRLPVVSTARQPVSAVKEGYDPVLAFEEFTKSLVETNITNQRARPLEAPMADFTKLFPTADQVSRDAGDSAKIALGGVRGLARLGSTLTSMENVGIAGGMGAITKIGPMASAWTNAIMQTGSAGLSAFFASEMGKAATAARPEIKAAWDAGDVGTAAELAVEYAGSLFLGGAVLAHSAGKGVEAYRDVRQVPGEARRAFEPGGRFAEPIRREGEVVPDQRARPRQLPPAAKPVTLRPEEVRIVEEAPVAAQPEAARVTPEAAPTQTTPEVAPEAPATREPWQMTREEYIVDRVGERKYAGPNELTRRYAAAQTSASITHRDAVSRAVHVGKLVPVKVLADYPDLAPPLGPATAKLPAQEFVPTSPSGELESAWRKFEKLPEFVKWVDVGSKSGKSSEGYAVVIRNGALDWVRVTGDEEIPNRYSGGAFYDTVPGHPKGALAWAEASAKADWKRTEGILSRIPSSGPATAAEVTPLKPAAGGEVAPPAGPKRGTPKRSYDDVQAAIDTREAELEANGEDVLKLLDPNRYRKNDGLSEGREVLRKKGWKDMPQDLSELYRERDSIQAYEDTQLNTGLSERLTGVVPDEQLRSELVTGITETDKPVAIRGTYRKGNTWKEVGVVANKVLRFVGEKIFKEDEGYTSRVEARLAGTPDNPGLVLTLLENPVGYRPYHPETFEKAQAIMDALMEGKAPRYPVGKPRPARQIAPPPVPPEVLADYPDLAPSSGPATAAEVTPSKPAAGGEVAPPAGPKRGMVPFTSEEFLREQQDHPLDLNMAVTKSFPSGEYRGVIFVSKKQADEFLAKAAWRNDAEVVSVGKGAAKRYFIQSTYENYLREWDKRKEKPSDRENQDRIPGQKREGQAVEQAQPQPRPSGEAARTGRIFQEQTEVAPNALQVAAAKNKAKVAASKAKLTGKKVVNAPPSGTEPALAGGTAAPGADTADGAVLPEAGSATEVVPVTEQRAARPYADLVQYHSRWEQAMLRALERGDEKAATQAGAMVDKYEPDLRKELGEGWAGPLSAEDIRSDFERGQLKSEAAKAKTAAPETPAPRNALEVAARKAREKRAESKAKLTPKNRAEPSLPSEASAPGVPKLRRGARDVLVGAAEGNILDEELPKSGTGRSWAESADELQKAGFIDEITDPEFKRREHVYSRTGLKLTDKGKAVAKTLLADKTRRSEGIPIAEYRPGTGKVETPDNGRGQFGWQKATLGGEPAYTDGNLILQGEAPGPLLAEQQRVFDGDRAIQKETKPVSVVGHSTGTGTSLNPDTVWLSNGSPLGARYYDHIVKRFPDAQFAQGEPITAIDIMSGGKRVGLVMPRRNGEPPANIAKILKAKPAPTAAAQAEIEELRDDLGVSEAALQAYDPADSVQKVGKHWTYTTLQGKAHPGLFDTKREALEAATRHAELKQQQYDDPAAYRDIVSVRAGKQLALIEKYRKQGMSEMEAGKRAVAEIPDRAPVSPKAGERGTVSADLLTLGAKQFIEQDVKPALGAVARGIVGAKDDILRVLAPAARGPQAATTALTIRARAAELARATGQAEAALRDARNYFQGQPEADNMEFIFRIEDGQAQRNLHDQTIANTLRKLLDERRDEVQALGTGKLQAYYTNYFPHQWKNPKAAATAFTQWFAKRPMEGPKSFLKKRSIPTVKDGIDAGLIPETLNPVDATLMKLHEMDKYIMAHRVLGDLKTEGLVTFVRATSSAPEGYKQIDDNIATVFGPPTDEGATTIRGRYYAPEPVATVLNNYLSPGLRGFGGFRAWMGAANTLNQLQLGLSGFHLAFTSMDASVSKLSVGIYQAAHGKPLEGLLSAAQFPIAAFSGIVKGDKILKEWFKPGTQGADIALVVDAMVQAGGRAQMDRFYQSNLSRRMVDAFRSGNVIGGLLRLPGALFELPTRGIMEWVVPRQKMAVFADMARTELELLHPGATPEESRAALAKAWDSVDNRMGQLVYDNLFWPKAAKDLAMASVRSVGWNIGTLREIVGGGADTLGAAGQAIRGRTPDVSHRMAYILALPIVAGLTGAVLHYLFTGQGPEQLKDYFFPRSGPRGSAGWAKRLTIPSYVKDVVHWSNDPWRTASGKLHPLITLMVDMLSNENYWGGPIRNPSDPLVKQATALLKHVGSVVTPLGLRGMIGQDKRQKAKTTQEKLLPLVGVTPAPRYITDTKKKSRGRAK